jgi:hypothetical protein
LGSSIESNNLTNKQLFELIGISEQSRNLNTTTNSLLSSSKKQLDLDFKNKQEAAKNDTLAMESDLAKLHIIHENIINPELGVSVLQLGRLQMGKIVLIDNGLSILNKVKTELEKGLSNTIVQSDKKVKHDWYSFFNLVSATASAVNHFNLSTGANDPVGKQSIYEMDNNVLRAYITFVNFMIKSLARLDKEFKERNKDEFIMTVPKQ